VRILIFEICPTGHRLQYVKVMLDTFCPLTNDIIFATSRNIELTDEYTVHLKHVGHKFTLDASAELNAGGTMTVSFRTFLHFYKIIKKYSPDYIYVPFADGLAQFLGIARLVGMSPLTNNARMEILLMRGKIPQIETSFLNKLKTYAWLKTLELSGADTIHFLNPLQFSKIKESSYIKLASRARLVPEPVEEMKSNSRSVARKKLDIPVDGRYIACLGRLDTRKGVDLLVRSYANANLKINDRLLLVGLATPEIKYILDTEVKHLVKEGRIIHINRYVSQEELEAGICAADVVCTPYPAHFISSGIVVRAAALGKYILASNVGWMGEVVPEFDLGETCNVMDHEIFSSRISTVLDNADSFLISERRKRFVKYHSIRNFSAHLLTGIQKDLELTSDVELTTWNWVVNAE